MRKKYFIDSENVGDNWIFLLKQIAINDEVLVFYTSKSPHMNYENVILLRESDKNISFVKCNEGNNALDFQLGTYLGYELHKAEAGDEFVIVSNDTGFDAIVKFWKDNPVLVTRIVGKDCQNITGMGTLVYGPILTDYDEENWLIDANQILTVFGKSDLSILYAALVKVLGEREGKKYYNYFKKKDLFDSFSKEHEELSKEQKQELYCSVVFERYGTNVTMPWGFSECVMKSWRRKKNLNSLRDSIQEHYGKEIGLRYYTIIKPHMKMLDKIK